MVGGICSLGAGAVWPSHLQLRNWGKSFRIFSRAAVQAAADFKPRQRTGCRGLVRFTWNEWTVPTGSPPQISGGKPGSPLRLAKGFLEIHPVRGKE